MDKIDEAREALEKRLPSRLRLRHRIMKFADAYALAAHVAMCKAGASWRREGPGKRCGDGWYCDEAKRYIKEAAR